MFDTRQLQSTSTCFNILGIHDSINALQQQAAWYLTISACKTTTYIADTNERKIKHKAASCFKVTAAGARWRKELAMRDYICKFNARIKQNTHIKLKHNRDMKHICYFLHLNASECSHCLTSQLCQSSYFPAHCFDYLWLHLKKWCIKTLADACRMKNMLRLIIADGGSVTRHHLMLHITFNMSLQALMLLWASPNAASN